jgi:hypothetical protein
MIAEKTSDTQPCKDAVDVSVVMPSLNEQESVGWCVERAWDGNERTGFRGDVVICDHGSVDVAKRAGARVVREAMRGYGLAYLTGIGASVGRINVIGDSGCSYAREPIHSGQPETSRPSRPTIDASASGGQPPAAGLEVP